MPSFSIYCDAEVCPVAKKLSENLRNTRIVERESEGHDADIEILLYKDDRPTSPKYFAKEDEKILTLVDPNCALVQSRRGFEVVKVVVVASAQSSAKENMICVLSEVLRGSGVSVQGRYSEYIKAYLAMDESQFAIALNGFSIFITMHFLEITTPGQDKASVDKALRAKFKIDN